MPWYIGTILGAVSLAVLNSLTKSLDLTVRNWLLLQVPLALCNLGFWYGFRHSDSFVKCWFLGSGMVALIAIPLGVFLFDKGISYYTVAGIVCILTGTFLLTR